MFNIPSKMSRMNFILLVIAPIILAATVAVIVYAWYINNGLTGQIDATTKNVAIEYTFDGKQATKNTSRYAVSNMVFFDVEAEEELQYIDDMAVRLDINLINKSSNDASYIITFTSTKQVTTENNTDISIAYVDCLFDVDLNHFTSAETISDIKETAVSGYTYTTSTSGGVTKVIATKNSKDASLSDMKPAGTTDPVDGDKVTVSLYIFGVQEIFSAKNDDFIYNANGTPRTYTFTLTIETIPQGEATVTENPGVNV